MNHMHKKIVGIVICMLMLLTIPVATAQENFEDDDVTGPLSMTYVHGFIIGLNVQEGLLQDTISFLALRVKYVTTNPLQEDMSGTIILQQVTFSGKFNGYLGQFYINGVFRGSF